MIRDIVNWRCKCGADIKVVTETDRTEIEYHIRITVSCPNCGERRLIYAHRIVEVSAEAPQEVL